MRLGTAMATSVNTRRSQLAGRETLKPGSSTCDALARRLMPFGLRGQAVCLRRFSGIVFPPRRLGWAGAQGAVPPDRLGAEQRLDVNDLARPERRRAQSAASGPRGADCIVGLDRDASSQPTDGGLPGGCIPGMRGKLQMLGGIAQRLEPGSRADASGVGCVSQTPRLARQQDVADPD